MVLRELKKIIIFGIKEYVFSTDNLFTSVLTILLICSYGLKFYTLIKVRIEKEKLMDPNFWNLVSNLDNSSEIDQINIYETFYWLNRGENSLIEGLILFISYF